MKDQFLKAIKERRIGEFSVSSELLKSGPDELMELVFSRVLVVRADFMFDYIKYVAYSPDFEPVDPIYTAPQYVARLKTIDGITHFDCWMRWEDHHKIYSEFAL